MKESKLHKALRREMDRIIGTAGEVVEVVCYEPAKGGGWCVVFSTEFAALRAYHAWATKSSAKGVTLGASACGGFYVSRRPSW